MAICRDRLMNTTTTVCSRVFGLLALACSVGAAYGDEPSAVHLFDRDTLVGWDYGPHPAKGWRMTDGVLQGDKNSTPLVSGWTWGDVTLQFRWKVENNGRWILRLMGAADSDFAIPISLSENRKNRARVVANPDPAGEIVVASSVDGWHEATLQRSGNEAELTVSTRLAGGASHSSNIRFAVNGRFGLQLSIAEGAGSIADLTALEPPGEPLYNGKDLSGWWTPGNLASWMPEEDSIICVNQNGNYLRTQREYANFTLSLDYKMAAGGNSGIGIRTAKSGWPSGDGMELQMLDEPASTPLTRHSTMAIYGNVEPVARADRSQEWNRVVIKTEGYLVSAWVNGVLVQHANTAELPELRRRNLKGWIGLQDHGARTEFRDLRVLEGPSEGGLKAWQAPRPQSGSQLVLDRLMNSERLAIDEHVGWGAVETKVTSAAEQTLAELSGPGAVVTVSRTNPSGQLALYFEGEPKPRLVCPTDKLAEQVPLVGQDTQPLLTFIPYRKSLKITIKNAQPGDYRLDYVRFADDVPLEEFSAAGKPPVARGLLPALSYRNEQLGWGTHREADPLPRAGSEGQKIDEQSQATLVDLAGPGVVQWTKLIAAPTLLADDDLWLEVTVDDESRPAIAAPARYFFPGLAEGNYPNYVVLNREGFTNMLAMPYRSRLTIVVANRGRRPVSPVGLVVSYQPLADVDDPRLAHRLRGTFQTATDSADREWAKQTGAGRFVGLVTQYGKMAAGVDSLLIDGKPQDGWHSPDWRTILGIDPQATNERRSLTGRQGGLQWRFFLLAPPEFHELFELRATEGPRLGNRLAIFYLKSP
ncbi:MAG TPA: family 16 glycoside hydrolase [Pirellulales bacterium]|nr:family 16 glycoside hydrolase [Pirellulales bacterium]